MLFDNMYAFEMTELRAWFKRENFYRTSIADRKDIAGVGVETIQCCVHFPF